MVCIIIDFDFPATIVYQDKIGIKMERMPDLSDILKHKVLSAARSDKTNGGLKLTFSEISSNHIYKVKQ